MNKARLADLRDTTIYLEQAVSAIEEVLYDEQEAFDNLPYGLQATDRGVKMEDAISFMEDMISEIEKIETKIDNFK